MNAQPSSTPARPLRWWSHPRALLRHILMLDDTSHSIALGVAIGMFVGLTPTVGIQMMLVVAFAYFTRRLFYFNRVAALLTVYVSNPVTMVPIYWLDYKVGTLFVQGTVSRERFAEILQYDGFAEWWQTAGSLLLEVGWPLILGSLFVGTAGAVVTYPLVRYLIAAFRGHPPSGKPAADHETAYEPAARSRDTERQPL